MERELEILCEIAKNISELNGTVYLVGGYVRDLILKKENKDIDVEVYGIELHKLKEVLCQFGKVDEVGSSFGILMIHGLSIDFAVPRREILAKKLEASKRIVIPFDYEDKHTNLIQSVCPDFIIEPKPDEKFTHKDFIIVSDPFMTLEEASKRRDFTINALMKNVLTGEIIDFWGGLDDIKKKIIRHIDEKTFIEDALRVLRACQFASRFEFTIAPETIEICKSIDLTTLPKERIFEELWKALMKGAKPSIAFEMMRKIGVIEKLFPELYALIGCPQNSYYHPEGNVWNHTMLVIDYASKLKDKSRNPEIFMFASLLHDVGKPKTTEFRGNRIISPNHDIIGVNVAKSFLYRITNEKSLIDGVCAIVRNHMRLLGLYPNASNKAIRRLSVDIDINEILLFAEADSMGKGSDAESFSKISKWIDAKLIEIGANEEIRPCITGKDLIALGMKPNKEFRVILEEAFDMQLEGKSKKEILEIVLRKHST